MKFFSSVRCILISLIGRATSTATEAGKDGSERSSVAAQDEQLSTKEMERRIKLLQEDR